MIYIFFHYTSLWPKTNHDLIIIFVLIISVFVLFVIRIVGIIRIKREVLFLVLVLLFPCVSFVYPRIKPLVILIAGFGFIIFLFVLVFIVLESL